MIQEHLLRRIVKRSRGGLVSKAHRLVYHSTLCSSVIKKEGGVDLHVFGVLEVEVHEDPLPQLQRYLDFVRQK